MAKTTITVQVLKSPGVPAGFAVVQIYKYVCVWFICWDDYKYQVMTDMNGKASLSLDVGATWRLRGLSVGKEGNARFTLTSVGVGTVKQWGELIVTVKKA